MPAVQTNMFILFPRKAVGVLKKQENGTFYLPEGEAMVGSKLRTIRNKT